MDAVEHTVARPFPEIAVNRRTRRKVLRQLPPLTACTQNIAHRIHHLAHVRSARPPAPFRWRDQSLDKLPFRVRHIARIALFARRMLLARCFGPHGRPQCDSPRGMESYGILGTQGLSGQALSSSSIKPLAKRARARNHRPPLSK